MTEFFSIIWLILKNWWWFFLPIIFWFGARFLYFWWIRWEVRYPKFKWILLEIKPPKETIEPFRAMESVFSSLWGIIDSPNWREKWCEGMLPLGGGLWFSFEIVSIGGKIHFYLRIPEGFRNSAETAILSYYPNTEISLADDYTKYVPPDIPNKEWDLQGEDFVLAKDDPYPIKTYPKFFEEKPEIIKEEKRLDPMEFLLEELSRLKSGEQVWIQIVCNPIFEKIFPWVEKGRKIADKIAKRPAEAGPKSMIQRAIQEVLEFCINAIPAIIMFLFTGKPIERPAEKPKEELIAPELRLTPGEKECLAAIENKISKPAFQVWIRALHLYKINEPYTPGFHLVTRGYFAGQFQWGLNNLTFWGPTRTRIHYWLKKRRLYLRKRIQFKRYVDRLPSLWPRTMKGEPFFPFGWAKGRGTSVLNIEELATIFHFPTKIVTPGISYVEAKKASPPPGLAMR